MARGKLQMDLMAMALICGLTRVGTLQWTRSLTHDMGSATSRAKLVKIHTSTCPVSTRSEFPDQTFGEQGLCNGPMAPAYCPSIAFRSFTHCWIISGTVRLPPATDTLIPFSSGQRCSTMRPSAMHSPSCAIASFF